jgi:hypothetical protein
MRRRPAAGALILFLCAGRNRSVAAHPLAGAHQKVGEHGIVLHDFKSEFAQFVAGRLRPDDRW